MKIIVRGTRKFFFIFILIQIFNSLLANPIEKDAALLKLLDKTTNKVEQKIIKANSSTLWGSLNITIYACFSSPPDEIPENYVLLNIIDKFYIEKNFYYKGWMISSSPDVTPLEHPVYDLWLVGCTNDKTS